MNYRQEQSTIYLIGAGPGDPNLITIKAKSVIEKADVIIYDNLVNEKILNWSRKDSKRIFVGKKSGQHSIEQEQINKLLVKHSKEQKCVVRLKGGDPLIFGRAYEEIDFLEKSKVAYEIIPGITSALACAAYSGIPITHRDISSSIIFITGHENQEKKDFNVDFKKFSNTEATLCIYMGVGQLHRIVNELILGGMRESTPVAIVENGTYLKQRSCLGTLSNITELAKSINIKSPSIIFVGDAVEKKAKLNWFESKPLFGKTILVPRSSSQASSLTELLNSHGAHVLEIPFINIEKDYNKTIITDIFSEINSYDWIIFTSTNGVYHFFDLIHKAYEDIRCLGLTKIATVGQSTANAVRLNKLKVELVPSKSSAKALADSLINHESLDNTKILLVTGNMNSEYLSDRLQNEGRAIVDKLPLYKNINNDVSKNKDFQEFMQIGADLVMFTSSSTVKNYFETTKCLDFSSIKKPVFSSIGENTSNTLRELEMPIAFESPKANLQNYVVEALSYFNNNKQ